MAKHDFGIVKEIDVNKDYGIYEPHKYGVISVDDDIVEVIVGKFNIIKTYYHSLNRPGFGLAYCGVTLIPPSSLCEFREIILNEKKNRYIDDLNELIDLVGKAIGEDRYIIHFGI